MKIIKKNKKNKKNKKTKQTNKQTKQKTAEFLRAKNCYYYF
jgi:hypothetical protein